MTRWLPTFLAVFLAALGYFSSGIAKADEKPWISWQTSIDRSHPLVGRIWSVKDNNFIPREDLVRALAGADFRLLGETHDNPDHHRLQAWLIREIVRSEKRPAVVMEMIDRDQSPALIAYLATPTASAAGLGVALDWEAHGWPDWAIYQPIAEVILNEGLDLVFGNEPRNFVRATMINGLTILDEARLSALKLDVPLEPSLAASLRNQIIESHCNMLPVEVAGPMADGQRLRDAVLAEQMNLSANNDGAILIAGNGHIRTDRAVPWYLARRAPGKSVVSLMIVEVESDLILPDLIPMDPDNAPAANYVWFTPRAARTDPCEEMRRHINSNSND